MRAVGFSSAAAANHLAQAVVSGDQYGTLLFFEEPLFTSGIAPHVSPLAVTRIARSCELKNDAKGGRRDEGHE